MQPDSLKGSGLVKWAAHYKCVAYDKCVLFSLAAAQETVTSRYRRHIHDVISVSNQTDQKSLAC